jgi:hypothetical protein
MTIYIIIFITYIYPLYRCIKFDRAFYGIHGKGHAFKETPTFKELIAAFIPLVNIFYISAMYINHDYPYIPEYQRKLDKLKKEKPLHPILKFYFNRKD